MFLLIGVAGYTGMATDFRDKLCTFQTMCIKFGVGGYAIAGGAISLGFGELQEGRSSSLGLFILGGLIEGGGLSVDASSTSFSSARGVLGKTIGGGFGVQYCTTDSVCQE